MDRQYLTSSGYGRFASRARLGLAVSRIWMEVMMERRDFIRLAAAGAAGVAVTTGFQGLPAPPPSKVPDLAVVHGGSPEAITKAAVDALGGMKRFISKGDIVVVKPNIGWDRTPEQAANTNPAVVAALVKMCLEAGAKKVSVFDNTCNDARRCYVQSGIEAAAKAAGADVSYINERRFKEKAIKGEVLTSWPIYQDALDADKIINVPIAKTHGIAGLTLGLKNWMGVMGGQRGRIHQKIGESLGDLALVLKPTLTVLDAVRILTANGPQGGNLKDVKKLDTVVAGVDQVAVDAYGASFFGKRAEEISAIAAAARRGIGIMDLTKLTIQKLEV
jgi:uncharacterized protein (DUF362 family)